MEVQIVRSARKTLSLQVRPDGQVVVRAPYRLPEGEIRRFLAEKQDWLQKHLEKVNAANQAAEEAPLSAEQIRSLAQEAIVDFPPRVEAFARQLGVTYGRITIRNQATRWGSCSSQGNLNFNCLLMLAPSEVRDYVVVHELCHRKQMNHSAAFWAEVAAVLPDYREPLGWLKTEGSALMARMEKGR